MKKNILLLVITIAAMCFATDTFGQKAKHKVADKFFQTFDYKTASEIYSDILSNAKYANDTLALRRLAICQQRRGQNIQAEGTYKQLAKTPAYNINDMINLAEVLKLQGKYNEAIEVYRQILVKAPGNDVAKRYVDNPDFATAILKDSAIYTIKNSAINGPESDFAPSFFTNGKLIFSSARGDMKVDQRIYSWNEQPYLNVFLSDVQKDSSLANATPLNKEVNSRYHEGTATFDHRTGTLYFTRNNILRGNLNKSSKGLLNLGIFASKYDISTETWSVPQKLSINNKEYSVGHPTLNGSGTRMYFVSDMPGGAGGTDIYYIEKTGETWGSPVNAGNKINTSANEMFPFMVGDSTLYFSSNGQLCMGGFDIFFTNPLNDKPVQNIGYPANSHYDDFAFICFPDEAVGFFSSTRTGGKGDDDIYEFRMRPVDFVLVSGTVVDLETLKPISNATVSVPTSDGSKIEVMTDANGRYTIKAPYAPIIKLEGNKQNYITGSAEAKTNPRTTSIDNIEIKLQKLDFMAKGSVVYADNNKPAEGALIRVLEVLNGDTITLDSLFITKSGAYMFPLMSKKSLVLEVTKEGYARQTDAFNTFDDKKKIHERDFKIFKPEIGTVVRLDNIYYDYNSDVIRPDAAKELDKLVQILRDNPTMKIELSSHSDSRGGDAYNLKLSDRRAKSAVAYMVTQGIAAERMVGKGYGEQKILNHCKNDVKCSEEEHQFNRRTEFTITGF